MLKQQDHSGVHDRGVREPTSNEMPSTDWAWNSRLSHTYGSTAHQAGINGDPLEGTGGAVLEMVPTDGARCHGTISMGGGVFLGPTDGERLCGSSHSVAAGG